MRFYTDASTIIRDRVTEIERPDWWWTDEEVRASLRPEAAVRRVRPDRHRNLNGPRVVCR
jgi:hypothetical protein